MVNIANVLRATLKKTYFIIKFEH